MDLINQANKISKTHSKKIKEKLTSAEIGKLWVVYMGNSMSICVLSYFLNHVEDTDIKGVVQKALNMSKDFMDKISQVFNEEGIPIPIGFTEDDVNVDAPRLFADQFYLHYLKYLGKAGLSIYSTAIPLMIREDVRELVIYMDKKTIELVKELNEQLGQKGYLVRAPIIPIPPGNSFVQKQEYLNGFLGDLRPLHALEITHIHDNIENNVTSKCLLIGFSQVAHSKKSREFFLRGKDITMNHIEKCTEKLHKENLPAHPILDDLVEVSTIAPFSDKLMISHKIDMFSMKIRSYSNALSLNGRRDIGAMYGKFVLDVGRYVEDATNIMIDKGWMEEPPHAVDRNELAKE